MERGALVLVLGGRVGVVREEQGDEVGEAARRGEHEWGPAGLKGESHFIFTATECFTDELILPKNNVASHLSKIV